MAVKPSEAVNAVAAAIRRAVEWALKKRSDMTFPSASMYSASVPDTAGDTAKQAPATADAGSQQSRLVIGVAGGSGSGKTTVVRRIVEALGPDSVSILEHDRYYRDRLDLRLEDRMGLNWDHPDSLETDLMVRHVVELKAGRAVEAPLYDFPRYCRRTATETIEPRAAIIAEGI